MLFFPGHSTLIVLIPAPTPRSKPLPRSSSSWPGSILVPCSQPCATGFDRCFGPTSFCVPGNSKSLACAAVLIAFAHPAQVEAITWVSGRKDLLAAPLLLGTLLAFIQFCEGRRPVLWSCVCDRPQRLRDHGQRARRYHALFAHVDIPVGPIQKARD